MSDDVKAMTDELVRDPTSLVFLRLGEVLRLQGQADAARKLSLMGIERHPALPDAHDLHARVVADAGESENAERVWQAALELDSRYLGAHKGLAFLQYRRGDLDWRDKGTSGLHS